MQYRGMSKKACRGKIKAGVGIRQIMLQLIYTPRFTWQEFNVYKNWGGFWLEPPFKCLVLLLLSHTYPPAPKCPQENLPFPVKFDINMQWVKHCFTILACRARERQRKRERLTERGIGWGNGLLLPSKLSYVAFQLQQSQNFLTMQRQWVLTK